MEKQGQVFDVFASEAVFLAEMSGYETAMNDGRGGTAQATDTLMNSSCPSWMIRRQSWRSASAPK